MATSSFVTVEMRQQLSSKKWGFWAIKFHFDNQSLPCLTIYQKSTKPTKVVIHLFDHNSKTDIDEGVVGHGTCKWFPHDQLATKSQ
jgi:hypothetical protein